MIQSSDSVSCKEIMGVIDTPCKPWLCETGLTRMKKSLIQSRSNRRKQEPPCTDSNQRRLRKITEELDVNVRFGGCSHYLCLTMTSSPFSIILQILTGLETFPNKSSSWRYQVLNETSCKRGGGPELSPGLGSEMPRVPGLPGEGHEWAGHWRPPLMRGGNSFLARSNPTNPEVSLDPTMQ